MRANYLLIFLVICALLFGIREIYDPAASHHSMNTRASAAALASAPKITTELRPVSLALPAVEDDLVAANSDAPPSSREDSSATYSGLTSLPVAFLVSEADFDRFTVDEDALITDAQKQFVSTMAMLPNQDPGSPGYYRHWLRARQLCDDWLRIRLGHEGFNRFSSIAAQTLEQQKHSNGP